MATMTPRMLWTEGIDGVGFITRLLSHGKRMRENHMTNLWVTGKLHTTFLIDPDTGTVTYTAEYK